MSLFKKFTDFCAGIAAFVGGLFLLQKYMTFKPLTDSEYAHLLSYDVKYNNVTLDEEMIKAPSKIKQFFTPELVSDFDYRMLAILIVTLMLSVIVGIIFRKLPYVCFFFSLVPAVITTYVFTQNALFTQIGLFLIFGALHVAGNLFECVIRDREDGKHRVWLCAKISTLFPAAFCLLCTKLTDKIVIDENINDKLPIFKEIAKTLTKPENMELVTKIGWMFLIIFVVTTLFYNVYFIDVILSAIPVGYTVHLLYSGNLAFNPALFTVLALICFMTHIVLCTCENNLSRKEQMQLKKETEAEEEPNTETEIEIEPETEARTETELENE